MSDLVALCDRAVRVALRAGADGAEAFALREWGGSAELEKHQLASAEWVETSGFGVRVLKDHRVGFAYASTEDRFKAAAQEALKTTRLGKALPRFRFPGPAKAKAVAGLFDRRVVALRAEDLLDHGAAILDAVTDVRDDLLVAGGSVHAGGNETALVNSEGLERHGKDTGLAAHAYVVQRKDGVSTGFASRESTTVRLDAAAIGREAADLAVRSSRPRKLEKGGTLPCVVRPEPASDLLSTVTVPGLYGKPAHRGESFYSGKLGKAVAHPTLTLVDDATVPGGLGSASFDDDGVPTGARKVLAKGVLKAYLYDVYDASEYASATTANAVRAHAFDGRSYKSPPSTSALQMRLEAPQARTEKLVASLDDGLLLHDMMGVHTANAASGDFSVTSSVVFRIRRGSIEGPVAPLSIAGNVHAALKDGVRLGDDVKPMSGSPAWTLPSVLFGGFSATP